jgi:hypothetical protein
MGQERPNYPVRAMSAMPPTAAELLHYGNRRTSVKSVTDLPRGA